MVVICVEVYCMIINSVKIIYFLTDKSGENTMKNWSKSGKNNFEMCCEPCIKYYKVHFL